MSRILGLASFLGAAVWLYFWEFIRAAVYERALHMLSPYLTLEATVHYGGPLLLVCTGLVLFWKTHHSNYDPAQAAESPAEPTKSEDKVTPPEERVFVDVSPDYLLSFFRDHTSAQARRLTEPYVGKWITITGPVFNVDNSKLTELPTLSLLTDDRKSVLAWFQSKWWNRLDILTRGQVVTVIGEIDDIGSAVLSLRQSEIVDLKT